MYYTVLSEDTEKGTTTETFNTVGGTKVTIKATLRISITFYVG
jgi:hypothetical protein